MLSLLDIAERMQKGPKMDENAWDMGLFHKMNELTEKYKLVYPDDGSFFSVDDGLADRAFRAAMDFLTESGVYCVSTRRLLRFSEQEVAAAIQEIPREITVGEGRDARVIKQRRLEEREAINQCPGHHAPWTEELASLVVKNFAQISSGDYLEGFNFTEVDGREISGMPMEVYAARRQVAWMREGIRKAGRPGMAIAYYPINTRAAVMIAPIDRDSGLRPTDGVLLSVLPGIKVEQDFLAAAMVYEEYGSFKVNGGGSGTVGGFAGGLGGAIIEAIVRCIVGFLVYRDTLCATLIDSLKGFTSKTFLINPGINWGVSVVFQALHRHTNTILFLVLGSNSGPGTEANLLELAIGAISAPINGANLYIPRQFIAQTNASQTPLQAEWVYEVASAAMRTGLNRGSASDLARKIGQRLEGRTIEAPVPIAQCYDLVHHRPLPDYEKTYLNAKEELSSLGLSFA